jgi:glucarate dehydratase
MTINDLEFCLVEVGRADEATAARTLLVRVVDDEGREGWGESGLAWRPGELAARRHALLSALQGRSIFDIEELLTLEALRPPALRAAVEMACWDLIGRTLGQPLCRLWGGEYRPGVPVAARLPRAAAERVAEIAAALAEQGFLTQTVAAAGDTAEDERTLAAIRRRAGDRVELRLDGRLAYDLEAARDLCAQLEYDSPQFFADPLNTRELYPVASLARQTGVPLAVGRSIHGPADALAAVRSGAAAFVLLDLDQLGGLTAARKCAAVIEAGGAGAVLWGGPSLGIAAAAALQLAAATPALSAANECSYHQLRDDVLAEPLTAVEGIVAVPRGPGLGVEVDRAKVEQRQVG